MKGSRILPDLQEPLQTYRMSYTYSRTNGLFMDAIDSLDGMNMMLASEDRIKISKQIDLLRYHHDASIQCPKCSNVFELQEKLIINPATDNRFPSKMIPPRPSFDTYADRLEFKSKIWNWISIYHNVVESSISGYRRESVPRRE